MLKRGFTTAEKEIAERLAQFDHDTSERIKNLNTYLIQLTEPSDDESVAAGPGGGRPSTPSGRAPRLLWVDDFPSNNRGPIQVLNEAGIRIETVLDTKTAIDRLHQDTYDVVISDMGRGDDHTAGLALLRAMQEENLHVPVIIYASSRAVAQHGDEAKRLGAIAAVTGPTRLMREVGRLIPLR